MARGSLQWSGGNVLSVEESRSQLLKCLKLLEDEEDKLNSKEVGFVDEMRETLDDEDNALWKPTYPQLNYAKDLVEKYCY